MAEEQGGGGALRELLAVFGFEVDTNELKKGETALSTFVEKIKKLAEGIAAAFAVEKIYEFAEGQAKAMNAIERASNQLGISIDEVQAYQHAARSLGLDADSLINSMGRLQVVQQAASQGGKKQAETFSKLGVKIRDENGHLKEADQLFIDVADKIADTEDASKKAGYAVALFGKSGRSLLPILNEGADGIDELVEEFHQLGGGYTEATLKAGKEFDQQQARTGATLTALKGTIAKALLPIVTALSKAVQSLAKFFNNLVKDSNIVKISMIALAAVATGFAVAMAIAFAPFVLGAAAIGILVLLLEDLYTFFTGGKSLTGDLLDKIFGKGTHIDVLEKVRDVWYDIKEAFQGISQWVHRSLEEINNFVDSFERIGVILRARMSGKNVAQALAEHEIQRIKGEEGVPEDVKENIRRFNAIKRGDVYRARGETQKQAELAANVIRYKHPELSPEFGPLPYIPGVSKAATPERTFPGASQNIGGDNNVNVSVNVPPGLNEKQVGEHVAKQVSDVMRQQRRDAAATVPRSGQ